jgi:hypothetical protein
LIIAFAPAMRRSVDQAGSIISGMDDRRLTPANEQLFPGAEFAWKAYKQPRPGWDHDHCSFCWAEFMEDLTHAHTETFTEGYTTAGPPSDPKPDYYWVCPTCFADFRDRLGWTLQPDNGDRDQ